MLELAVDGRDDLADGVIGLTLHAPGGEALPSWEPGAHIDLCLSPQLERQYSLCGSPTESDTWQLAIALDRASRGGSRHVHERLVVGDRVRARGPRNNFPLVTARRYLFIAGGIGITPLRPMIENAQAAGIDWTLVYGARSRNAMAFADELCELYGDRATLIPQDVAGLIDLPGILDGLDAQTQVYCCGPEPMLAAIEGILGHTEQLHLERFAAVPVQAGADRPFEVEIASTGEMIAVPAGTTLLAALEAAGYQIETSCQEGICGTCETPLLNGLADHRDHVQSPAERAANEYVFPCVSRALSPRLVLDL